MATEVINGGDLFVFIGGVPVAHSTAHTLSITRTNRIITTKDTGKFVTRGKGRITDVSGTANSLMVYGDFEDVLQAHVDGDPVSMTFGEKSGGVLDTSKSYASGTFIITSYDENAPDGENAGYSLAFKCDGTFTFTEV